MNLKILAVALQYRFECLPILNVRNKFCYNEAKRPSNKTKLYMVYTGSKEEPLSTEIYLI